MKRTDILSPVKPKLIGLALACALAVATNASEDKAKQQKQIQTATQDTLQRLYKAEPKTKAVIKHAYGYAVFSDLGVKILFGGTGNGKGVAVNNHTKQQTYMKMIELQAGLGLGVDKFRVVFVSDNQRSFDGFINSRPGVWWRIHRSGQGRRSGRRDGRNPWRWQMACGCIN